VPAGLVVDQHIAVADHQGETRQQLLAGITDRNEQLSSALQFSLIVGFEISLIGTPA
jgi:hypothetical protein